MRDTRRFRERIIEFCQAPLPAARGMLHDHPELLSDLAAQQPSLLCDVTGESAGWRSQATFRTKWALIVRAWAVGVQHAVAEAEAAQPSDMTDEAWDALSRAVDALRACETQRFHEQPGARNRLLGSHAVMYRARTVRSLALLSSAADLFGELILTAHDMHRFLLYDALHMPRPKSPQRDWEKDGSRVTSLLWADSTNQASNTPMRHPRGRERRHD
jgi:hypothetical protein